MEVFDYEVHALALGSREMPLNEDPIGPFDIDLDRRWLVQSKIGLVVV